MKIQPLNNNLLVEVLKVEKTRSGIIIASDSDLKYEKARVIAFDQSLKDTIKKDSIVYFKMYTLSSIDIDGKEYNFIKFDDVLGIEK